MSDGDQSLLLLLLLPSPALGDGGEALLLKKLTLVSVADPGAPLLLLLDDIEDDWTCLVLIEGYLAFGDTLLPELLWLI